VKPVMAIFIKYEFWMNFLNQLKKQGIPTYIVSAIFRPNQLFFRWYGKSYGKVLQDFEWLFVQDENSKVLLKKSNIENVSISGDTRFDRVYEIYQKRKEIPLVERFINQTESSTEFVLVAGSTWDKDEDIIIPYFNQNLDMKLIIAPHEINESHIKEIISKLNRPFLLYSQADEEQIDQADCLIIDCFGLLSSIYRYGELAYIGGGFGVGIHNVLEAAVYGIPILFGTNYHKFKEAKELINCRGAFSISNANEFAACLHELLTYNELIRESGESAKNYVIQNLGATQKIYDKLF
jgi:3-deoxy-D-manno-octulosonic-acid transferase